MTFFYFPQRFSLASVFSVQHLVWTSGAVHCDEPQFDRGSKGCNTTETVNFYGIFNAYRTFEGPQPSFCNWWYQAALLGLWILHIALSILYDRWYDTSCSLMKVLLVLLKPGKPDHGVRHSLSAIHDISINYSLRIRLLWKNASVFLSGFETHIDVINAPSKNSMSLPFMNALHYLHDGLTLKLVPHYLN